MRVFNAHVSRTRLRSDSVHKCVQTRRNAADLYKQFDPHCRTCTQRGIFARFSVLTVSACLHVALLLPRTIVPDIYFEYAPLYLPFGSHVAPPLDHARPPFNFIRSIARTPINLSPIDRADFNGGFRWKGEVSVLFRFARVVVTAFLFAESLAEELEPRRRSMLAKRL